MTKFRVLLYTSLVSLPLAFLLPNCSGMNADFCEYTGTCAGESPDLGFGGDGDMGPRPDPRDQGGHPDGGAVDLRPPPVGVNPDMPGPNRTVSFDLTLAVTGGTSRFTVIGPTDDGSKLSARGAPHPLVLFSPGLAIEHKSYSSYGERLASYGIVTVLQNVPAEYDHGRYRDNSVELLNWLLHPTGTNADRVKGFLDEAHVGVAGHSLGGKISLLVAAQDSRIKAYFGIDPVDSNNTPAAAVIGSIKFPGKVPLAFVGETTSKMGRPPCAPAEQNFEMLYGKAASPAFAVTMPGVAHGDWVDNCTVVCTNICPGGTAPRDRTSALTAKYIAAYFLWSLTGDLDVEKYLDGAPFQKDIDAGFVTKVAK